MSLNWSEAHQRYNPLRKSWVLCSPHRTLRPWQGQQEGPQLDQRPQYDEKCYLCPGNKRAQGEANPKYETTYVFTNDFAAVKPASELGDTFSPKIQGDDLFRAQQATGRCSVICFSPRHDLTLARMSQPEIRNVINAWKDVYQGACEDPEIAYCQIFENKGAAMGCSNPHPHGQAWMTSIVPEEPAIEHKCLGEYEETHQGRGMLEEYVAQELEKSHKSTGDDHRVIDSNESFVALVPYWATWPFEVMVVSKRKIGNVCQLTEQEQKDFAEILKKVAVRYDNLFECSFPYSMGLHQLPANASEGPEHLHVHFYPPLLRSASVKKFLVGFEMMGMPQRDITPEQAAAKLRALSAETHYLDKL